MDPNDLRGDESTEVPIDHVDDCELIASPETISGGKQAAAATAPGTLSASGEGETAVDDSGRDESKENCNGQGACELVASPAAISGGEVKDRATEAEIDGGESCALVAQAVIPSSREVESSVDDGSSENCGKNAATAMISGGGEEAAALDGGGGGKICENVDNLDKDMAVPVEGYGQVAAPVMISGGLEAAVAVEDCGISGRKRGRPRRGQVRAVAAKKVKVEEEEDVCFICFDGGSLVLCDRRGCPKAYHPACLKHDEAFFESKAKWTCDWHICSICQKAAHHMCYTCTYSLCKTCTKGVGYLSLRENRGLCAICMRTIMLIERDPGDKDTVQVDFDDKNSWEYFFKYYWVSLKEKLSFSLDELIQAKTPHKAAEVVVPKEKPMDVVCVSADCKSSISSAPSRNLKATDSKKRRVKEQCILPKNKDCHSRGKSSSDKSTTLSESPEWATEELLEFVAHMRSGDVSMLSQFEIQGLLLEYIKRNNLRDPRQKSQIICDSRLMNLFGKPRVAHFEMLKLLEYHFLIDKDNQKESTLGNIVRSVPNQVEGGGNNESLLMVDKDKKRKARRKGVESGPQTNLDEFAAIDVHNINLIYLRRGLMENLVTANANFHDKVVGSIVRIRISGADPKQDMYRLVQVIGTCKASVPYQVGGKTVDMMLVILNLHKKETVAIDSISNQEFSVEECRRLRQSIKCGLVKRITVGLVQEKARALQEVRLNDWLETEMVRLSHLRDRASEKGLKKELRECVEKIELLKTPEECQRRLNEKLQVHADPKMDPKCESDDDAGEVSKKEQADQVKQRYPGVKKLGRDLLSMPNKSKQAKFDLDKEPSSRFKEKVHESPERKEIVVSKTPIVSLLPERKDTVISETPTAPISNGSETEMIWHYRDPNGKIQGPFCLVQLRKWSTTGYFPQDMRVWGINTDENASFLLTDVLNGDFLKALPSRSNISLPDGLYICEDRHSSSVNPTLVNDGRQSNRSWNCTRATSMNRLTVHESSIRNSGTSDGNLSSVGNKLSVNIASNNPGSNLSLMSVAKSADSSGPHQINFQNMGRQASVTTSKDQKPSQSYSPVQDFVKEELPSPTLKLSDRDEKGDSSTHHKCAAPMAVDMDEKINSSVVNLPNFSPNASADEIAQPTEIKPPGTCCTSGSNSPTQSDRNMQNLQNTSRNTVDGGNIVNLSIHNSSSSPPNPRDRDDNFGPHERKSPLTRLTFDSVTSEQSYRDEKAGVSMQNLPILSSKTVNVSIRNSSNLPPNPKDADEKFGPHESKPPLTNLTCDSITSEPSDRDEEGDVSIRDLLSLSSKTVNEDGKIDSTVENLSSSSLDPSDGNDKVRVNESNQPGTILTFTSSITNPDVKNEEDAEDIQNLSGPSPKTIHEIKKVGSSSPDTKNGNEKTGIDFHNLPSPSLKTADQNDNVGSTVNNSSNFPIDSTSENEKVLANEIKPLGTSLICDFTTPESNERGEEAKNEKVDLISNTKDKVGDYSSTSTSNWGTFSYEPIELCALAEESVSDLWAEVDAMEAQGDLAHPTSGDDFFEDSISGIDHLFDFGKTDDTIFNGESSWVRQPTIVSEPLNLTQFDIFDSSKMSDGINNHVSFGMKPIMGSDRGNSNPGFGGLNQGMSNLSWGTNSSLVQFNMDMNQNTSFGFMGDERRRDWRGDGSRSQPEEL